MSVDILNFPELFRPIKRDISGNFLPMRKQATVCTHLLPYTQ